MNLSRRLPPGVRLLSLIALACFGCGEGGDALRAPDIPPGASGIGIVTAIPNLEGGWKTRSTVIEDTCGALGSARQTDLVLQVTQAGAAIDVKVLSACGTLLAAGGGTVDGSGVVSFTTTQTVAVDAGCSLGLEGTWSSTVNEARDRLTGSATLTVSADGDCGAGLPCRVESTFIADRCPTAGCAFPGC